jgi:hypothetical protein
MSSLEIATTIQTLARAALIGITVYTFTKIFTDVDTIKRKVKWIERALEVSLRNQGKISKQIMTQASDWVTVTDEPEPDKTTKQRTAPKYAISKRRKTRKTRPDHIETEVHGFKKG